MPIPKPHEDESHDAFMDRCMADAMMMEEHEDSGQRFAVCQNVWEDAHKSAKAQEVQSVIFSRERSPAEVNGGEGWTASAAKAWLKDHDFKAPDPDETEVSFRFRQFDPELCEADSYVTLSEGFPAGVSAVSCKRPKSAARLVFWKEKGMRYIGAPFEVKQLDERGTFEGIASVYGNVDLGGDIVLPGAFKEFVETRDGQVRVLDAHDSRRPIGKARVTDTHLGLAVKGRLNLAVTRAREIYELMKDGIVDGLSIGYDVIQPDGSEVRADGVRVLKKLKLWEISTTIFPMNPSALVSDVKSLERVTDIRELEDLLRDAVGLSRAQAKLHAGAIWATKTGQRDAGGEDGRQVQRMIEFLNSIGAHT